MDKNINPFFAALIIVAFLIPIAVRFWAGGEWANARVGFFYLEQDALGQLSLQVDHLLVTQAIPGTDQSSLDLSTLGTRELAGNVAYLANNDFLLRAGDASYGLKTYLSLGEARSRSGERLRQTVVRDNDDVAPLLRCSKTKNQCQPVTHITVPWRYRLYVDNKTQHIYVTDATSHKIRAFDASGTLLATRKEGLKFPKRIRPCKELLCLVDTNHHRLVFFDRNLHDNRDPASLTVVNDDDPAHRWPLDAVALGEYWWVINAGNSMQNNALQRFDSKGRFLGSVTLPSGAEPFDLLPWKGGLLVSDLHSGRVYRLNEHGNVLAIIRSSAVDAHVATVDARQRHFQRIITLTHIVLVLMVAGGVAASLTVARRHRKLHPDIHARQVSLPAYLSPSAPLYVADIAKVQQFLQRQLRGNSMSNVLISNIEIVPGKRVTQHLGLVQGSTVRAKHAGKDLLAGLKNIVGGEISSYTELLTEARDEAIERMVSQAKAIGANAVINVRFSTSSITAGASEILAYGTAVCLEDM